MAQLAADNKALSMTARKSIRDHTADKEANLKTIEQATGVSGWTFDFEGDVAAFNNEVDACYKDRLGEIFFGSYLKELASMFTTQMKDDMVKEAFLEAATTKKIVFTPVKEKVSGVYQNIEIKDGVVVISCTPKYYWSNISELAQFKLETLL